jgi:outer membrane murein-binding lipoprotein Lpp
MRLAIVLLLLTGCSSVNHIEKGDDIVATLAANVERLTGKMASQDPQYTEDFIEARFAAKRAAKHAEEDASHPAIGAAKGLYDILGPLGTTGATGGFLGLAGIAFAAIRKTRALKGLVEVVADQDPETARRTLKEKKV